MIKTTHSDPEPLANDRAAAHPGWWTVLAVLLAAWIGVPVVLPLVAAAPWCLFRWRQDPPPHRLAPTFRWALAVWVTGAVALALAGDRALRTIPFGAGSAAAAHAWLDGVGSAVPPLVAMLLTALLFVGATLLTRGVAGAVVLAAALLISGVHASVVLSRSWNVLGAAPMAIPLWSAFALVGMILLLDPLAAWGEHRVWRMGRNVPVVSRRRWIAGAALILAAIAARLVLENPLSELARRLTLP